MPALPARVRSSGVPVDLKLPAERVATGVVSFENQDRLANGRDFSAKIMTKQLWAMIFLDKSWSKA